MTDNEVFRALCKRSVCACPHCDVTSIPTLVNILNASYYSVRKCIKSLETKIEKLLFYKFGDFLSCFD